MASTDWLLSWTGYLSIPTFNIFSDITFVCENTQLVSPLSKFIIICNIFFKGRKIESWVLFEKSVKIAEGFFTQGACMVAWRSLWEVEMFRKTVLSYWTDCVSFGIILEFCLLSWCLISAYQMCVKEGSLFLEITYFQISWQNNKALGTLELGMTASNLSSEHYRSIGVRVYLFFNFYLFSVYLKKRARKRKRGRERPVIQFTPRMPLSQPGMSHIEAKSTDLPCRWQVPKYVGYGCPKWHCYARCHDAGPRARFLSTHYLIR